MISNFDIAKLNSLLKDFYSLTRIRITVFDNSFTELTSYPEDIAPFCQIIHTSEKGALNCYECNKYACRKASQTGSDYTYRCHAGLTESITPIIIENIVAGYLLFGHVFDYDSYQEGWENIEKLCAPYDLPMQELKEACFSQPIISNDFITAASHIMKTVGSYICMERMVSLRNQELPVRIEEYIQAHYTEDIGASEIANHFGIGKTRLYEISKQSYGIGIAEYIRKLRIEKACLLLEERPDLPLSQVASLCGFKDYNYFITVFRKITGIPPKAFARSLK